MSAHKIELFTCKRCSTPKPLDMFRWGNHLCTPCYKERRREYYRDNKDKWKGYFSKYVATDKFKKVMRNYEMNNAHKLEARLAVRTAVAKGTFKKTACVKCDEPKSEFHHSNGYDEDNWFVGMWVCRPCHVREHKPVEVTGYGK